jgi:hypothetical protein
MPSFTAAPDATQPSSKRQKGSGSNSDRLDAADAALSDDNEVTAAAAVADGDDLEALFEAQQQQQERQDAPPPDDELDAATLAALVKLRKSR